MEETDDDGEGKKYKRTKYNKFDMTDTDFKREPVDKDRFFFTEAAGKHSDTDVSDFVAGDYKQTNDCVDNTTNSSFNNTPSVTTTGDEFSFANNSAAGEEENKRKFAFQEERLFFPEL